MHCKVAGSLGTIRQIGHQKQDLFVKLSSLQFLNSPCHYTVRSSPFPLSVARLSVLLCAFAFSLFHLNLNLPAPFPAVVLLTKGFLDISVWTACLASKPSYHFTITTELPNKGRPDEPITLKSTHLPETGFCPREHAQPLKCVVHVSYIWKIIAHPSCLPGEIPN